ncbi:hypothetical protein ACWDR1_35010 [Streptosporangium sandarakinum]
MKEGKHGRLARSTTHDILSGKRKRLPSWPWVASFVAACHAAAAENGLADKPLESMDDWHDRWLAARAALKSAEGPLPDPGPAPPSSPADVQPAAPATAPAEEARAPGVAGAPLSEEARRDREVYGRIGARLLAETDVGNPRDCMRMAVIALPRNRPQPAYLWLHRAGDAVGLPRRPSLLMAAAELACRYGRDYEGAERIGVALFFYRLAYVHGHAAAACQLFLINQREEEERAAETSSTGAGRSRSYRAEIIDGWGRISDPPGKAPVVALIGSIEAPAAAEPVSPVGDPLLALP